MPRDLWISRLDFDDNLFNAWDLRSIMDPQGQRRRHEILPVGTRMRKAIPKHTRIWGGADITMGA